MVTVTLSDDELEHVIGPLFINWYLYDRREQVLTKQILTKLIKSENMGQWLSEYGIKQQDFDNV